jgi:hypothetical protein
MLSNICLFKAEILVREQRIQAIQFGAVATRKDERGKGLSRHLMEHVLGLYPDTPAFLFANPNVSGFYPRFGFRQVQPYRPTLAVAINNMPGNAVKCSPDDDFIYKAIHGGRIHSGIVDFLNTQPVQIFHLLISYPDGIFYLPDCEAVIIAEQSGSKLFLVDVITQNRITFNEISKQLPFSGVESVEFGFCPDWLGVTPHWEAVDCDKDPFFVRGNWDLPDRFLFPALSAT